MKLFHVQDPSSGSDAWAANKGYVDAQVGLYLPLAGGTMTGQLILDRVGNNTNGFTIKGKDGSGADIDLLRTYHNNGSSTPDAINYLGRQDSDTNIVTNQWVKDNTGVELYDDNTPPATRDRGTLLMTNNNQLYIYTG